MKEKDEKSDVDKPINTNAAPTIVAFTFQFERALYSLFQGHGARTRVGLETLDDVAELTSNTDGTVSARLEQDANTLQLIGQPFQDSSYKLWHTLRIWLSHVRSLREQYSEVHFYLVTNVGVPANSLARVLSDAVSDEEVKSAVSALRKQAEDVLRKEGNASKDASSKDKQCTEETKFTSKKTASAKAEMTAVLKHVDEDLCYLVRWLTLLERGGTGTGEMPKEATIQLFQLPSGLVDQGEEIYQYLLGIAVDTCRKAWTDGEIVWLTPQTFRDHLHKELDRRLLRKYLDRPMVHVEFREHVEQGGRDFFFLKQLSRLGLTNRMIDKHLDRYWAFYIERVRLEKEGFNHVDWETRENSLHERWQDCRDNAELELSLKSGATPENIGVLTLTKTLDENYKAGLGRYETNNTYFTQGHYHQMANRPSDQYFVYWHPAYGVEGMNGDEGEVP
ncbi:MAG: hypothetical protein LBJ15_11175 [Comamonas sp.]|jgi:hypothetical protein|uniref:ABC-three component system protein n=1 Tax=Comamonas sp. TaxID=34028 RepID=UPI00281E4E2B|nr:ABC-three component system protein [Comamonas sp.]MDR0214552.1 hypothetical protein [Comamonas sp.]